MSHLFKKFSRDINGLIWAALSTFIGISLWSYSPLDPSFNSIGKGMVAKNYCGYIGSFLADGLYQTLGLTAWVLVVFSAGMAWRYFKNEEVKWTKWRVSFGFLLMVVCASLAALYFPEGKWFSGQVRAGGELGLLVSRGLTKAFNFAGVAVILWTALAALSVFYTERPLFQLLSWPAKLWDIEPLLQIYKSLQNKLRRSLKSSQTLISKVKKAKPVRSIGAVDAPTIAAVEPEERRFFPLTAESNVGVTVREKKPAKLGFKVSRRIENWELPKLSHLEDPPSSRMKVDEREIRNKARLLTEKLAQFGIQGEVVGMKPGPAVTLFEFKPAADVKISRITDLADDLSLALSSESVRIIAPIPGRDVVGIETSNAHPEKVFIKDIVTDESFWQEETKLPIALGRKADGEPRIVDLRRMPHLLVAGTTGSGKSVFVVSSLVGLLLRHSPKTLKLILVDPKQVDLAAFSDLPHLIMPPIREPRKAVGALRWAIREMEKRYRSMARFGARGLEAFNEIVSQLSSDELKEHQEYNHVEQGPQKQDSYYFNSLPYIVIVVEEFGDLMAVDKVNVEQAVVRLAQMARACGIHLLLAMQSPRRDVVTGLIKTNIPGRISFKVASKMDSRIILDEGGAERLLARGDMLFLAPGVAKPERHHGPFVSENEINAIVEEWKKQGEPDYDNLALRAIDAGEGIDLGETSGVSDDFFDDDIKDDRYDEVLAYVSTLKEVSASLLQRKFRLGYPRAARMIEVFASEGVVGPANGSKPRSVLIKELK